MVTERVQPIVETENSSITVSAIATNNKYKVNYGNAKFRVKVKRNIDDGTFSIEIPSDLRETYSYSIVTPYIDINDSEVHIEGRGDLFYSKRVVNGKDVFIAPPRALKNMKYEDIKKINVGLMIGNIEVCIYMCKIVRPRVESHYDMTSNSYLEFNQDSGFELSLEHSPVATGMPGTTLRPRATVKQNNRRWIIVPHNNDRMDYVQSLASIYLVDDQNTDPRFQMDHNMKVITNSFQRGLEGSIDIDSDDLPITNFFDSKYSNATHIGEMKIDSSTYYDYENGKTIKGISSTSKPGELIPYSFSGTYHWLTKFDNFLGIKNFEFNISQNYKSPFLDQINGDIQIRVDNDYVEQVNQHMYSIYPDDLEKISGRNIWSLRSLKGLSY